MLFDYRTRRPQAPALSEAERLRIVQVVLKAVVWEGLRQEVSINSAVTGAFSKRGARETVYMLQQRATEPMDTVIAVLSGDRVVAAIPAPGSNAIVNARDVDGDGVDELLLDGSVQTFGVVITSARLVRLNGRALKTVHDFGGVYEGGCGNGQSMGIRAGVLVQSSPGKDGKPGFRVDLYGAPCRTDGQEPALQDYKPLPGDKIANQHVLPDLPDPRP